MEDIKKKREALTILLKYVILFNFGFFFFHSSKKTKHFPHFITIICSILLKTMTPYLLSTNFKLSKQRLLLFIIQIFL